jgi:hypothetical protein
LLNISEMRMNDGFLELLENFKLWLNKKIK